MKFRFIRQSSKDTVKLSVKKLSATKIFLIWNIVILFLCIALVLVLRERIAVFFGGQKNSAVKSTFDSAEQDKTGIGENENVAQKVAAEKGTDEKNTSTPKRRPRKPKEVNFNDSNATSFSIKGFEDGGAETEDEIRFAGTSGTGKKIVFVLDSTGIMGSNSEIRSSTPWSFASDELAFSFKDLNNTQQFQVFFFADKPDYLQSAQGEAKWIASTPQNKKEYFDFLKKHIPSGSGSAFSALKEALVLKPDAVFFLTTQKSIPLTEAETEALKTLQETLPKIVPLHTVEIGEGAESSGKSSFQKLANLTKGQYRWVNANIRGLKW